MLRAQALPKFKVSVMSPSTAEQSAVTFRGRFHLTGADSVGILQKITRLISANNVTIIDLETNVGEDGTLAGTTDGDDHFRATGRLSNRGANKVDVAALSQAFAELESSGSFAIKFGEESEEAWTHPTAAFRGNQEFK